MSQRRRTTLALLFGLLSLPTRPVQPAATTAPKAKTTTVILQTSEGDIHIALDLEHAPQTEKNFLACVDSAGGQAQVNVRENGPDAGSRRVIPFV